MEKLLLCTDYFRVTAHPQSNTLVNMAEGCLLEAAGKTISSNINKCKLVIRTLVRLFTIMQTPAVIDAYIVL